MELIVGLIVVLVVLLILSEARTRRTAYRLRRDHMDGLQRLDERVRVSLPPFEGELVSAAIDEVLGGE